MKFVMFQSQSRCGVGLDCLLVEVFYPLAVSISVEMWGGFRQRVLYSLCISSIVSISVEMWGGFRLTKPPGDTRVTRFQSQSRCGVGLDSATPPKGSNTVCFNLSRDVGWV